MNTSLETMGLAATRPLVHPFEEGLAATRPLVLRLLVEVEQ